MHINRSYVYKPYNNIQDARFNRTWYFEGYIKSVGSYEGVAERICLVQNPTIFYFKATGKKLANFDEWNSN